MLSTRALAIASSSTAKSKRLSSCSTLGILARVVGLTEITPQYSGIAAANLSAPICRAISIMSPLSITISGRSTSVLITSSITDRLTRVWLATCATLSPVTSALALTRSANCEPARSIMRLRITPIWALSTCLRISPTTPSKGTETNFTGELAPYFIHRYSATSFTPIS